jgi:hypothetical protein
MMSRIFLFCLFPMLTPSCSNPQKLVEDASHTKLYFGHSGGFTNVELKYVLLDNGAMCRIEPAGIRKTATLTTRQWKQVMEDLRKTGFEEITRDQPGNLTYFIRLEKNGTSHEVRWSDPAGNENLASLYKALTELTNR